jgi:hypothetical protein
MITGNEGRNRSLQIPGLQTPIPKFAIGMVELPK